MARGFGATLGSGSTDSLASAVTSANTLRSYAIWTYRNGNGGSSLGTMWDKSELIAFPDSFIHRSDTSSYRFLRKWDGADGIWDITRPGTGAWVHIGVSYDGSSTSNAPVVYFNGSSQTVNLVTAPTGALETVADRYIVGNRLIDSGRVWDGSLAEFAVWDATLPAEDFAALSNGLCPLLLRPTTLVEYIPMLGPTNSYIAGATTLVGTAVQPHPRMHYPARRRIFLPAVVAGAGRPALVGGKLTNSLLLGGLVR